MTHSINFFYLQDRKQIRELRSLSLKVIYIVLGKYDDHNFGGAFWDMFFTSVKPLVAKFKKECLESQKPSSLFYCFIAMSKSYKLVPLLSKEENLVPDIFSMLSVPPASESILSCILKFTKNLLKLDNALDTEDATVKRVFLPHLDKLICGLHCIFTKNNVTKRYSFPHRCHLIVEVPPQPTHLHQNFFVLVCIDIDL